jgi:hypothetical protein
VPFQPVHTNLFKPKIIIRLFYLAVVLLFISSATVFADEHVGDKKRKRKKVYKKKK